MERARKGAAAGLSKAMVILQTAVNQRLNRKSSNIMNGGVPSSPGEPPARGTGALAKSFQLVKGAFDGNNIKHKFGSNLPYAGIQEFGGRIRAKRGKFMAIPIGTDGRWAAREANGDLRKLNLTLIQSKGNFYLVKELAKGERAAKGTKMAKGAQTVILFKLVKQVTLPPRPYLRPSIKEKSAEMVKTVNHSIMAAIAGRAA